jgi:hypothetical protein
VPRAFADALLGTQFGQVLSATARLGSIDRFGSVSPDYSCCSLVFFRLRHSPPKQFVKSTCLTGSYGRGLANTRIIKASFLK